jgi:hypothetical protein
MFIEKRTFLISHLDLSEILNLAQIEEPDQEMRSYKHIAATRLCEMLYGNIPLTRVASATRSIARM